MRLNVAWLLFALFFNVPALKLVPCLVTLTILFLSPAIPWLRSVELVLPQKLRLGPGLVNVNAYASLQRLWALDGVYALVAFGLRGLGEAQLESDLDLAVILSQSQLSPE